MTLPVRGHWDVLTTTTTIGCLVLWRYQLTRSDEVFGFAFWRRFFLVMVLGFGKRGVLVFWFLLAWHTTHGVMTDESNETNLKHLHKLLFEI